MEDRITSKGQFMQTLAAYLFKANLRSEDADRRMIAIENEIDDWLKKKGAENPTLHQGSFKSLSGDGEGRFTRNQAKSKPGIINNTTLVENTHTRQTFTTNVQVIHENCSITIYSTLSVTNKQNIISPQSIYPRCPRIVRNLLTAYNDWSFGGQPVPTGKVIDAHGEMKATALCDRLIDPTRNFPIIVASIDPEEQIWDRFPDELARNMVGIAHVAIVDEEGSWAMTDKLGKMDSCYLGAVRLYWPVISSGARSLRGTVWTPSRLRTFGTDEGGMNRFLSLLRGTVMSAAALTITPPASIRSIYAGVITDSIRLAEKSAVEENLNFIVEENYELTEKLDEANRKIAELEGKIHDYTHKLRKISENGTPPEADEDDNADDSEERNYSPPSDGEIRYYKKIGNKGGIDILKRTGCCNHNAWHPAFRADQAEKGLLKLEGQGNWQSLQHCGTCTGGGRWRVHW